jgi:hypothetical protein
LIRHHEQQQQVLRPAVFSPGIPNEKLSFVWQNPENWWFLKRKQEGSLSRIPRNSMSKADKGAIPTTNKEPVV